MTSRYVPAAPPRGLEVQAVRQPPRLHVRLCGELDIFSAERLEAPDLLLPQEPAVDAVVLDLRWLTFCDVTGTRALVRFRDAHHDLGRVVAARDVQPTLLRTLQTLELAHLFFPGTDA